LFNQGGPVTEYKNDVGPGWHGLLDEMHTALSAINPAYQTVQVKEKFGCLRVYLEHAPIEIARVLGRFEARSGETCEQCGKPGVCQATKAHGWIKTLCRSCRYPEAHVADGETAG
jgi:hypothetical protein